MPFFDIVSKIKSHNKRWKTGITCKWKRKEKEFRNNDKRMTTICKNIDNVSREKIQEIHKKFMEITSSENVKKIIERAKNERERTRKKTD